ncbi:MAG: TonB-dependent receptor plug domain-containing protein [Opitutaceae bacterium]|jgi:outer membrane receptor protein involved in Fe transport|nr:TonB-dependent receptor plug domain-containing protein [Opitutaceae bacterium]
MRHHPLLFTARIAGLASIFAGVMSGVFAQTQTPLQTSPDDEIVTLSVFKVVGEATEDYMAAEQTAGTRYASKLMETHFSVQVITSEYLNDFKVLDFNEALAYTSSFSDAAGTLGGTGAFVLRGVRSFSNYKDGVLGGFLYGTASLDHIEVVKGTNASIYGQTSPTGMVNNVTKTANLTKTTFRASYSRGTDDYQRALLDVNVPLINNKLALRVAASYEYSEQNAREFFYQRRTNLYATLGYKLGRDTDIKFSIDHIRSKQEAGISAASVVNAQNKVIGILGMGDYKQYYGFNPAGPSSNNPINDTTYALSLSHRFNRIFSLRVFGAHDHRTQNQFRVTGAGTFREATRTFADRTARIYPGRIGSNAVQADLLAQFSTGPVKHKILLTFDYLNNYQTSEQYMRSTPLPVLNIDNPVYYNFPQTYYTYDRTIFDLANQNTYTDATTTGVFLSERASMLRDRLIVMGGVRYDSVDTDVNNRVAETETKLSASQPTYQSGILFKVIPDRVSLYASYSQSFTPQTNRIFDYWGNPFPNSFGKGYDAGIKASILKSKLNFTVGVFGVDITNMPLVARDANGTQLLDPNGASYNIGGEQSSGGMEFDFNWTITKSFGLVGTYAYIDARWIAVQERLMLDVPPANNPRHVASLMVRYSFANLGIKGLSTRIGVRYRDKSLLSSTIRDENGTLFTGDAYFLVEGGIFYEWHWRQVNSVMSKLRHRLDFNVKNLFDEKVVVSLGTIERFMLIGSYTVSF